MDDDVDKDAHDMGNAMGSSPEAVVTNDTDGDTDEGCRRLRDAFCIGTDMA